MSQSTRSTRAEFACDLCRQRKIKCVVEPNGCKSCQLINKPCTFKMAEARKSGSPKNQKEPNPWKQSVFVWVNAATAEKKETAPKPPRSAEEPKKISIQSLLNTTD